jgi:outer membrane receptor protein involved in Fe transport
LTAAATHDVPLFAHQLAVLQAATRDVYLVAGAGAGKTRVGCIWALTLCLANPAGTAGMIVAPTYPVLRQSTMRAFLDVLAEFGIPHTRNKADNVVTITATKRTEKLQAVPLSVKAITGDELERRGVSSLEEALPGEPSVVFSKAGTPLSRSVAIRGVSDGAAVGLTQSTVAMYIDDIPTSVVQGNGNIDLGLFDIENVLVIRGPRSTLYGSASLGGTIKITTRNPSLKAMESYARLGLSKTNGASDWNNEAVAGVSVPLVKDVVALGLTAYRTEQAGVIDAGALGKDVDKVVTSGARIALFAQPTPQLSVSGRLYLQDLKQDSTSVYNVGTDLQIGSKAVLEPQSDKLQAANLSITYKMPGFDIVSATSYFDK